MVLRPASAPVDEHVLRADHTHHIALALLVESGDKKVSAESIRSQGEPENRSKRDPASSSSTTGGMNREAIARQKPVAGNSSRHHFRHRTTVRRSAPVSSWTRRRRRAVNAPCIAETIKNTGAR